MSNKNSKKVRFVCLGLVSWPRAFSLLCTQGMYVEIWRRGFHTHAYVVVKIFKQDKHVLIRNFITKVSEIDPEVKFTLVQGEHQEEPCAEAYSTESSEKRKSVYKAMDLFHLREDTDEGVTLVSSVVGPWTIEICA
jgi:hypothetical protein